ncbi:TetR/AcrR family transcriptional regulator [Chondrinema litorale]|uniref:TetR/AcrR family transcriptional regulator n=1 Tax=Chondrinema litorale TaxID=2994555 RepID=UPI0025434512|nr:TetR/AcrR family transcriptional regulator [Chondrinema litorale]UZR93809.1 TetR/AcrR family transcriptional regulator [Chondrinema litorale]
MGIKERRERERIRRNNEIVDAAEKVISKKGMQNTTMDDIAKEAELGKATIYGYYKSKEEILLEINKRAFNKLGEMFSSIYDDYETGLEKLNGIGRTYIQFAKDYPNYYQFISLFELGFTEKDPIESSLNGQRCDNILINAIKDGQTDGSVRKDLKPEIVAKLLWSMTTGVMQLYKVKGDVLKEYKGIDEKELFEHYFLFLRNGIAST